MPSWVPRTSVASCRGLRRLGASLCGPVVLAAACAVPEEPGRTAIYDFAERRPRLEALHLSQPKIASLPWREDRWIQPAQTRVTHRLRVPPAGRLEFSLALLGGGTGVATEVALSARTDDRRESIRFTKTLRESAGETNHVDLSDLAESVVELAFTVRGDEGTAVAWIRPRLLGGQPEVDLETNVILIVIDTLRADCLAAYGGLTSTPHFDALAREGRLFERAYAHVPITGPSHASIFTSRYPTAHAVHNNVQPLDGRFPTWAETMRENYRSTAAVVSLGVLQGRFGFSRGFDRYDDEFAGADWWRSAATVNERAIAWLRERPDGPFFLWIHYSDPHEPYTAPGTSVPAVRIGTGDGETASWPADGRRRTLSFRLQEGENELALEGDAGTRLVVRDLALADPSATWSPPPEWTARETLWGTEYEVVLPARLPVRCDEDRVATELSFRMVESLSKSEMRERYEAEVEYVDHELGVLRRELESLDLLENTVLILTSDHGEGLGDHADLGHVDELYESQLRVPLLLWSPARLPPAIVGGGPAHLVDLLPTALELIGSGAPAGSHGESLVRRATSGAESRASLGFTFRPEAKDDLRSVLLGEQKYILNASRGSEEVYDLAIDPLETSNRLSESTAFALRARDVLGRLVSGGAAPAPRADLGAEDEERLRALGYVR